MCAEMATVYANGNTRQVYEQLCHLHTHTHMRTLLWKLIDTENSNAFEVLAILK